MWRLQLKHEMTFAVNGIHTVNIMYTISILADCSCVFFCIYVSGVFSYTQNEHQIFNNLLTLRLSFWDYGKIPECRCTKTKWIFCVYTLNTYTYTLHILESKDNIYLHVSIVLYTIYCITYIVHCTYIEHRYA